MSSVKAKLTDDNAAGIGKAHDDDSVSEASVSTTHSAAAQKRWRKIKNVRMAISALYNGSTTHDVVPEIATLGHPKRAPHPESASGVFKVALTGGPSAGKTSCELIGPMRGGRVWTEVGRRSLRTL